MAEIWAIKLIVLNYSAASHMLRGEIFRIFDPDV